MSTNFVEEVNFIIDCATLDLSALKRKLFSCTHNQFRALIEAVINAENLTSCEAAIAESHDLAQELEKSSEGLWRCILIENCKVLRTILASIASSCLQQELLDVLCCDDEEV